MDLVEQAIDVFYHRRDEAAYKEGKTPRAGSRRLKMRDEMVRAVSELIAPQLEEGFHLDLNDAAMADTLGISERRARQLRLDLKEAGLIFFPEWSRPKKKGDYPYWMLDSKYMVFQESPRRMSVRDESRYLPLYWEIYDKVKREFNQDLEEADSTIYIDQYMMVVHTRVNQELASRGLTRDDVRVAE